MTIKWKIHSAGKTDIGMKRKNNQDSFLVNDELHLYIVADGMGGHKGGEIASAVLVEQMEKEIKKTPKKNLEEELLRAIQNSNEAVFKKGKTEGFQGMGTTLTCAWIVGDDMLIGQVGDSRAYLFRDGELFQITEDHSQVYELLKAGLISEENMHNFQRNIITRSVGFEAVVRPDLFVRKIQKGDRYLFCSDGLSALLSGQEVAQVLQNFSIEDAIKHLIEIANLKGGDDNITAILVDVS